MNLRACRLHTITRLTALIFLVSLGACSKAPAPVKGFVLPEGNIELGKEVFASVGCRYCHTIAGEDFPPFDAEPVLSVELGGKVTRVKTYGDLLNSIVTPNHTVSSRYRATLEPEQRKDAKSPMPEFNDVLTVTQLIDLTAYLHSKYELLVPEYRGYSYVP